MKISLIAAVSADGFIAREHNEFAGWSSSEDKKVFVELTKRAGVMVMGSTTYKTIGKALPGRRNIVYTRGTIEQEGIETTAEAPEDLLKRLEQDGFEEVAIIGGATIYDMFLRAGLVTDVYLTIEPVLFGAGISLAADGLDVCMHVKETKMLNDDTILMHYEVER